MRYQLICFKDEFKQPHYFAFRESTPLGEGSFGKVYLAYPFTFKKKGMTYPNILEYQTADSRQLLLDKKIPFVVKVIPAAKQGAKETFTEYKHAKHYIHCLQPETFNDKHYFCQEYLPGEEISQRKEDQSPPFQSMDFIKRVEVALSLVLSFHRFTVHSPETSWSIHHHDLKGENVIVDIKDGWPVDLHIFDFGLSELQAISEPSVCGTPGYAPPEAATADYHPNSDVYSIGIILLSIFGAFDPLKSSDERYDDADLDVDDEIEARCKVHCNFKGLLKGCAAVPQALNQVLPKAAIDVIVRTCIQHMLRKQPEQRPSPDQCLQFFTALNLLTQQYLFNQSIDDQTDYKTKLRSSVFSASPKYDLRLCIKRMQAQLEPLEDEIEDDICESAYSGLDNPWFSTP